MRYTCHNVAMSHDDEFDEVDYRELERENEPWLYRSEKLHHYYGDIVRQIFVGVAALALLAAPFYADDLRAELPFTIISAVFLIIAAALTGPWNTLIMAVNVALSGIGFVIFELWALAGYETVSLVAVSLRQIIALAFMFALYFSVKTLRSMLANKIVSSDSSSDAMRASQEEARESKLGNRPGESFEEMRERNFREHSEFDG